MISKPAALPALWCHQCNTIPTAAACTLYHTDCTTVTNVVMLDEIFDVGLTSLVFYIRLDAHMYTVCAVPAEAFRAVCFGCSNLANELIDPCVRGKSQIVEDSSFAKMYYHSLSNYEHTLLGYSLSHIHMEHICMLKNPFP